ncbi:MAG: hypothetical protein V3T64_08510, partial [Myxococcota bacterium]
MSARIATWRLPGWTGLLLLSTTSPAFCEPVEGVPGTLAELSELRQELEQRDRMIEELSERLERLENRVERIEPIDGEEKREDAVVPEQTEIQRAGELLEESDDSHKDRLIEQAFERTLIERGGLLLPWRSFSIEPSMTYIHSSSDNIVVDGFTIFPVLVVGDIVSEKVDRDLALFNLVTRIGLPWDSQFELRVPYGAQRLRSFSADGEEVDVTDANFGDVEVVLSHQLYRSDGKWPDLLASAGWKFDSGRSPFHAEESQIYVGTGYHSLNLSVTGVKVIDPVVYFAGASYTYNLTTHERIGKFAPGYSLGFDLGMAIALNLNTALSLSYDQQFTMKSSLDNDEIPGSFITTGVFSVGSTYSFTDTLTIDFSLGI